MKTVGILALSALLSLTWLPAIAQVRDAPSGSQDRTELLNLLRPRVSEVYGPPVEFVVGEIRISNGFAYVAATPQRPGGGQVDEDCDRQTMECLASVFGLFQGRTGSWRLISYDDYGNLFVNEFCTSPARVVIPEC